MHFSATALALLAAAGSAVADKWVIYHEVAAFGQTCCASGTWYNDHGQTWGNIWFDDGCRTPYVTSVKWFCIDWNGRRAHFDTDWNEKRCMRLTDSKPAGTRNGAQLWETTWTPAACDWRLAATPELDGPANTTEAAAEAKRALPNSAKFRLKN